MKTLVWSDDDALAAELCGGPGDVVRATTDAKDPIAVADGLAKAGADFDIVLVGATKVGRDVGARLAALLDASYAADVQSLTADGTITLKRLVLSGNSMATYEVHGKLVATIGVGVFEGTGSDETLALEAGDSPITVTGTKGEGESDFDLSAADYVVGVGRGFKAQDDIQLAEDLAKALPGGAVGCSRPVAADLKWLGEEHWIGLSGNEIRPKVYFAPGISGQIQHIAGIRGSKLIVAINTNKDAPIFQVSDYGIVGDLYDVLPKLTAALKA